MKKLLTLTGVLSWINIITGSLLVLGGFMFFILSPQIITILFVVILPGAVILHSYAAMQLRKSILYPSIPLSKQTPAGIRMMGFMALFFGIISLGNGVASLQHAPELAKQIKLPVEAKNLNVVSVLRAAGVFTLIISSSIIVNIVLNFRLLRWYVFNSESEKNNENN
jgi:hypothetical protein